MIIGLALAAAAAVSPLAAGAEPDGLTIASSATPAADPCRSEEADEVVVCGKPNSPYRLDPVVLESMRAREAVPPKPPVTVEVSQADGCVGPSACKGDQVPLVRMALVAAQAAALAAEGEDWRQALRTREDEYRLYQQARDRRASEKKVRVSFGSK